MAGVLGIYGLIIAVIISTGINPKAKSYYFFDGYAHLSSGLSCGIAAGMAIGIVGDAVNERDFVIENLIFDKILDAEGVWSLALTIVSNGLLLVIDKLIYCL
ncbi:V-type proton ATPase 16 kDa proteolipid subunit-like [Henckelia pumila]|uniref:V-type proton ATPase 16 kDa proteolipid subunit-like n=1 Tax=Henckelia pumila TaxID=405737 RepID=UPI003C6E9F13